MALTFKDYLQQKNIETDLAKLLQKVAGLLPQIAQALKTVQEGYIGTQNAYGEKQLKLDVFSNDVFVNALKDEPAVAALASEELEEMIEGKAGDNGYSLAFDPLDGSSLVDVNLAVGTIMGIYKGKGFLGRKGDEQVAALIAVYGPRLTFMVSVGSGVAEFLYDEAADGFVCNKEDVKVAAEKKMFAPGNLRACESENWYVDMMQYWLKNAYTLRYSGGMVPDVNQILKKGGGIFTYPGYTVMPHGKLRLLYECAPMAYLMEQAGGAASNGKQRILEIEATALDHKTPIFLGSTAEVEKVLKTMAV